MDKENDLNNPLPSEENTQEHGTDKDSKEDIINSLNDNKFLDQDLDTTIEDIKEKKQKEREDKLADMMSHYHKKYSSPSLESLDQIANGNETTSTLNNVISPNHRRSLSATRKKDELAEQMKKYNDQFGNIISSVNNILSPSPTSNNSSNNSSPINSSPILNSTTPTIETIPSELNLCNNNNNNDNNNNNNNNNSEIKNNSNENIQYKSNETTLPSQIQGQQQQQLNFDNILFFEHQDIPMLTNVGFKTLKSIEMDAMKCSDSLIQLTKNLNYSLQMVTKMSVELFHAYRISNESLCQSVGTSIHETEIMINKCKELNDQTKSIPTLHQKIKIIKDNINRFESIILNIIKQTTVNQQSK